MEDAILTTQSKWKFAILNLDTQDRDTGSTLSAPVWSLNQTIQRIRAIRVITASIPNSYYVFTSANNTFTNTHSVAGAATVTIPPGTYNSSDFATALATALANGGITYTVAISATTNKMTVTASSGTFTFSFGVATRTNSPMIPMGFMGTASSTGTALTSPNTVQLQGTNRFLIQMTNLGITIENLQQHGISNLLVSIPTMASFPDLNQYFDVEQQQLTFYGRSCELSQYLNDIRLGLLDQWGNQLDLNGADWQISIGLEYIPL